MERKTTPQERYDKKNCTMKCFKLHNENDKDILDFLKLSGNAQGTFKKAMREYMSKH